MPISSAGLSKFKSSGNALIDALNIMGMFPTPAGMATEGPDAIKSIGEVLGIAKGEGIPKEEAARKAMIDAFKAKAPEASQVAPIAQAAPSMNLSAAQSVESLGKRVGKGAKAAKSTYTGHDPHAAEVNKMNELMTSWGHAIDDAMHKDTMETANKLLDTYKYLRGKLSDTDTRAYGWNDKISWNDRIRNLEGYITHRLNKTEFNKAPGFLRDRIRRELGTDYDNAQAAIDKILKGKK